MPSPDSPVVRRGRPREFDETTLLATAQGLFWKHGFAGVSLAEMSRATGVHKPSLYAAYGDKAGLFGATVAGYRAQAASLVAAAFAKPRLREAVSTFLRSDITLFSPHSRGCYVIGVATPAGVDDPAIRDIAEHAMRSLQSAMHQRISAASADELPAGLDPDVLTDLLMATHVTLAVRARAGEPAAALRARADRFIALFPLR